MCTGWLRALAVASAISIGIQSNALELHGRVLDVSGQPAAGARPASAWRFPDPEDDQEILPEPLFLHDLREPVTASERGEFLLPSIDDGLYVLSADGRSGAIALTEGESGPLELVLKPLVEVRGRFEAKAPGTLLRQTALWIAAGTSDKPIFVAVCFSESRAFRVDLPAGNYMLYYSTDVEEAIGQLREEPLVIQPTSVSVDLGTFELDLPLVLHPEGVVLDPQGQPVPALIAPNWFFYDGAMRPVHRFAAGKDGRFHGTVEVYDSTSEITLLALDEAQGRAGLATWNPVEAGKPLEIRLEIAVRLFGRYQTDAAGVPALTNTDIEAALPGRALPVPVAACQSKDGTFEFRLPPGKYILKGYGTDTQRVDLEIELGRDVLERDLEVIVLPLSMIARHVGQQAMSWHITDARGLPKDVKLADFRGKWVLIEFWGDW